MTRIQYHRTTLGNVLVLRNAYRGGGVLDLMKEPYTAKGICRVLHYEGGGGGQKYLNTALRNTRTFPLEV
jgi:hypothetical protein